MRNLAGNEARYYAIMFAVCELFYLGLLLLQAYNAHGYLPRLVIPCGKTRGHSDCVHLQTFLQAKENDKDDVAAKEAEFQDLLDSMLGEAQENISKKNIDVNSAEALMAALAEAKKLNLTEQEAAEEERKAVEEFSESFMEFIDDMVKVEGDEEDSTTVSFADAFGGSAPPVKAAVDLDTLELPTGPLSMSEALTMLAPMRSTLSKAEWDETMELLEEVSPEERFDICSFMVRARMKPIDEDIED